MAGENIGEWADPNQYRIFVNELATCIAITDYKTLANGVLFPLYVAKCYKYCTYNYIYVISVENLKVQARIDFLQVSIET